MITAGEARVGRLIFGFGALALGFVGVDWHDFAFIWQPVPARFPDRTVLAYLTGMTLAPGGLALLWPQTAMSGAIVLTSLFGLGVLLLDVPRVVADRFVLSACGIAEQTALVAGGALAYAMATNSVAEETQTILR